MIIVTTRRVKRTIFNLNVSGDIGDVLCSLYQIQYVIYFLLLNVTMVHQYGEIKIGWKECKDSRKFVFNGIMLTHILIYHWSIFKTPIFHNYHFPYTSNAYWHNGWQYCTSGCKHGCYYLSTIMCYRILFFDTKSYKLIFIILLYIVKCFGVSFILARSFG